MQYALGPLHGHNFTRHVALGAVRLDERMVLLSRPENAYSQATDVVRRKLHSTLFASRHRDDAERAVVNHGTLRAPLAEIRTAAHAQGNLKGHARIINAATGELVRELTIDPTRDYQPTGRPPGPHRKTDNPDPN